MLEEDFWTKSYKVQCFVHELIQRVQSIPSIINQSALLQCPALFNSHDQQQVIWDRIWNRRVPCCIVAFALAISMISFIWMRICRPRLLSACAHKQRIATFFSSRIHTGRHTIFMFNHFECRANGPQTHTHIAQNRWHQLTDQHHLSVSNCRLHSNFKYRKINHNSLECHTQNKPICACNSTAAMLWNGIYSKFSEMSLRLFAIAIGQYYAYGIPLRQCAHSPITLHSRAKIDGNQQKKHAINRRCNHFAICHVPSDHTAVAEHRNLL